MANKMGKDKTIQSVARSLDLLKAISEADSGLGVSEAADLLGIAAPSAHALLNTLVQKGLVEKSGLRYCLGLEAFHLYQRHCLTAGHRHIRAVMLALAAEYPGSTINYTVVRHNTLLVMFRVTPEWPDIVQEHNWLHYDIYFNLSGMLYMALLPKEEAFALRQNYSFAQQGAHLWGDFSAYETELQRLRQQGYASRRYPLENTFRLAVPVQRDRIALAGVLGLSWRLPAGRALPSPEKEEQMLHGIRRTLQGSP